MKFGIRLPGHGPMAQPDQLTSLASHAEELGFYAVELGDHIVIPEKISTRYPYTKTGTVPIWDEWHEQLTTLSYLAARTTKIHLVTSVMVLPYRHPILAAKMLATIDVLSKGRLIVGVGVGWMKEEFETLQLCPFDERGSVSNEYIRILKEVWTSQKPRFQGKYFSFTAFKGLPQPVQKPHPPIWIGGESPAAMKRAVQLGNGWYPIGTNPKFPFRMLRQLKSGFERLAVYAEEADRRLEEIQVSYASARFKRREIVATNQLFVGDAKKIALDIESCEELGISYISFDLLAQNLEETIANMDEFTKEIVPRLR